MATWTRFGLSLLLGSSYSLARLGIPRTSPYRSWLLWYATISSSSPNCFCRRPHNGVMFHIPLEYLSPLSRKEDCGQISREDPASAPHSPLSLPVSQSHADSATISCRRRAFRRDFMLDCGAVAGSIYVIRWHWLDLPAQLESNKEFWTIPPSRRIFADQLPVCTLPLNPLARRWRR